MKNRRPFFLACAATVCVSFAFGTTASADGVGATLGEFAVDDRGAATYRISIIAPSGAGGFQPQIALAYNSQGGDDVAGLGWGLEGLSLIHRCPRTLAQDRDYAGAFQVQFDDRDRFCLDGQRLRSVTGGYGAGGSEYRTEIDNFSRIRAYGWRGTSPAGRSLGPERFTVWTKDGLIMDYGRGSASRLHAAETAGGSAVRAWLLDRVRDRFGNEYVVRYHKDGERGYRVRRIDYGAARILFGYAGRGDTRQHFTAGAETALRHRLVSIRTYITWKMLRRYDLEYAPSPQNVAANSALHPSRLVSITECVRSQCLPPTRFDWRQAESSHTQWAFDNAWRTALPSLAGSDAARLGFGDFNGDGLNDVYEVRGSGGIVADKLYLNLGDGRFEETQGAATEVSDAEGAKQFRFADFDGDGKTDVYQLRHRYDDDVIYLSRVGGGQSSFERVRGLPSAINRRPEVGNGRCLDVACLKFGDFDGDGRADVYRLGAGADNVYLSNGDGTFRTAAGINTTLRRAADAARVDVQRLHVADVDGDGRSDLYYLQAGADDVHLNVRPGVYRRVAGIDFADSFRPGADTTIRYRFGDFNGDGLADVYLAPGLHGGDDAVYLSRGDGGFVRKAGVRRGYPENLYLGDFNGDGRSDLLVNNAAAAGSICFADGAGALADCVTAKFGDTRSLFLQIADFNGDGASDVYRTDSKGGRVALTKPWPGRAVTLITDGFGARTAVDYGLLSDAAVHHTDGQSAYPNVLARPPLRVVRSVLTEDQHDDLENETRYRYGDAKINLRGRGFLGFSWRDEIASARGLATRTHYLQDFPYTGLAQSVTVKLHDDDAASWEANAAVLSSVTNRYGHVELHRGASIFAHLIRSEESRYDVSLDHVADTDADFEYDDFSNLVRSEKEVRGDGRIFSTITRNTYANDEERWLLGQLSRRETTHAADGLAAVTRSTDFERDPETGVVTAESAGTHSWWNKPRRSYRYDRFGNRIARIEEGWGDAPSGMAQYMLHETRTVYDGAGRFPVRTINPLGHVVATKHGARFGQLLTLTDANNLKTRRHYNLWGQQIAERRPDGVSSRRHRRWICAHRRTNCSAAGEWGGAPDGAAYFSAETTSGQPPRAVFYDRRQRKIREVTTGDRGRRVFRDFAYDRFGRVAAESMPYFSGDPAYWTRTRYDALDRVVETASPADDGDAVSRVEYRGLATDYVNAGGARKTVTVDALGRTVRIAEPEGAVIEKSYDAAGNLVRVSDAGGNVTTMEYDSLGRQTRIDDPDAGATDYYYDAFNRIYIELSRDGASGASQRWTWNVYDALGRLLTRRQNEGKSTWTYDTAENGIGKLAKKKAPGGHIEQYRYDALGRLIEINDLRGYVISTDYDGHGRVARVTRPGGFTVRHAYDEQGRLASLSSPQAQVPGFQAAKLTAAQRKALQSAARARANARSYEARVAEYERRVSLYRAAAEAYMENPQNLPWSGARGAEFANRLGGIAASLARKILSLRSEIASLTWQAEQQRRLAMRYRGPLWIPMNFPTYYMPGGDPSYTAYASGYGGGYGYWLPGPMVVSLRYEAEEQRLLFMARAKMGDLRREAEKLALRTRKVTGNDWRVMARWVLVGEELQTLQSRLADLDAARRGLVAAREQAAQYASLAEHYRTANADGHVYYWRAIARDAAGRIVSEAYGNTLHNESRYDPASGRLMESATLTPAGRHVRRFGYAYDALGNLTRRNDHLRGVEESFGYDALDRLVSSAVSGAGLGDDRNRAATYRYDALGNLTFKSGVGEYAYGQHGRLPHAVASTPQGRYAYDRAGRMTESPDFRVAWKSYGKPASFTRKSDGRTLRFGYGVDHRKIKQSDSAGGTTIYVGNLYEKFTNNGATRHRHYIYAENRLVAIKSVGSGQPSSARFRYFHWDVLGSPDAVSDGGGNLVETFSYTPFGERRALPGDAEGRGAAPSAHTPRGFTGHEHLDAFGLVDMGGRVYAPRLGRFLSPDPYVQAPNRTQSYNRYSYVMNNPMKYADPSGFFFKRIKRAVKRVFRSVRKVLSNRVVRLAAAIGGSYLAGQWAYGKYFTKWAGATGALGGASKAVVAKATLLKGIVGGATFNVSAMALNGNFRGILSGGLRGGLSGALTGGVDAYFGAGQWSLKRVFADGFAGGAAEVLHGGRFADGFKTSLGMSALAASALAMREKMIAQSQLNPLNAAGDSVGFLGDGFKLAGGRIVPWLAEQIPSPFGGVQGGAGMFFGHAYAPGSWLDLVHEAYAGPHDFLNSGYWYDSMGNIKQLSGFAKGFGEALNFANLAVATPFVAASVIPAYAYNGLR